MALLFAVDGHLQVDDAVLPFGETRHLDGRAVGDLLVQALEQLFPHQLRADLPLGLVGDHIVREEMRAFLGVFLHLRQQLLQALTGLGRDGQNGVEVIGRGVGSHDLQQAGLVHAVDLVDHQQSRGAGLPQALDQGLFLGSDGGHRLHQQQHQIHIRHALLDHVDHVIAQARAGLVEARGVHQHELGIAPAHNGGDAVPGRLGFIGNNGDLLPHKGVGQSGFSHVGPSADGDHCRFCHLRISCRFGLNRP